MYVATLEETIISINYTWRNEIVALSEVAEELSTRSHGTLQEKGFAKEFFKGRGKIFPL